MATHSKNSSPVTNYQVRTFAFPLGGLFAIIALWPWVWHGADLRLWALVISGALIVPGMIFPRILVPAYRGWMVFAEKLGWFNTRVLLGLIFYGVLTPTGVIRGLFGKPTFTCSFDKQAKTYRVVKTPRATNHMAKPF